MDVYIFLFLGLFSRFKEIVGQKSYVVETSNVFATAFLKYNKHFRPYNESSEPLLLNVRFDLVKVLKVDPETPNMTSIVDTRFQWMDGRLYWYSDLIKHVTINVTEVWTPDVYFLNMESQPEVLINPRFLTIESRGKVFWYQRTKLITPCSSESYGDFICPVTFGSMQFPQSEIDFDRIECEYSNYANSKNVNVTSVAMEIHTEDLPRVPFSERMSKRGSCVAYISVDLEASNREKYSYQKFEAQRVMQRQLLIRSIYVQTNRAEFPDISDTLGPMWGKFEDAAIHTATTTPLSADRGTRRTENLIFKFSTKFAILECSIFSQRPLQDLYVY